MPGGVSSPVRSFKGVGGTPLFIERAKGAHIWDADGNRYIDYIGSWGPMILGHGNRPVLKAVRQTMKKGVSFGASSALEIELATLIQKAFPSIEKLRFVSSGTEAVMSVLRVARGFTGRSKIIKFDGCYHGHSDSLLVKAGSGAATLGTPDSAGVPPEFASQTLIAPFNDIPAVERLINAHPKEIAAIILEPIVGNMGLILPRHDFLPRLKQLCEAHQILLIFDEVMTGFRVSLGGVQELYRVKPDLTTLGKIVGGGFPVGVYGGRREIMEKIAPEGPVYQAGTLSGNPVAMASGIATLKQLFDQSVYDRLSKSTKDLTDGIREAAQSAKIPVLLERAGSMFTIFFSEKPIHNADDARHCHTDQFGAFFHGMLNEGVLLPPSQFEAAFVSVTHSGKEIRKTLDAARQVFAKIKEAKGDA